MVTNFLINTCTTIITDTTHQMTLAKIILSPVLSPGMLQAPDLVNVNYHSECSGSCLFHHDSLCPWHISPVMPCKLLFSGHCTGFGSLKFIKWFLAIYSYIKAFYLQSVRTILLNKQHHKWMCEIIWQWFEWLKISLMICMQSMWEMAFTASLKEVSVCSKALTVYPKINSGKEIHHPAWF